MRLSIVLLVLSAILVFGCKPSNKATVGTDGDARQASDDHGHNVAGDDDGAEDADEPGDKDDDGDNEDKGGSDDAEGVGSLAVYKNEKGQILCPVMDTPIESESKAFSHADYNGKRYYFCCDGCPAVFDKNKDQYAK